jgi:hypothetical protein
MSQLTRIDKYLGLIATIETNKTFESKQRMINETHLSDWPPNSSEFYVIEYH